MARLRAKDLDGIFSDLNDVVTGIENGDHEQVFESLHNLVEVITNVGEECEVLSEESEEIGRDVCLRLEALMEVEYED